MKDFNVKVYYTYEGYSGYEHTSSIEVNVEARNLKSAINKAKKEIPYGWFKDAVVKEAL